MSAAKAITAIVLGAGLIGLVFIGLAFGHALKLGDLAAVSRHPLFSSGAASLTTSIVCAVLLLRFGRSGA